MFSSSSSSSSLSQHNLSHTTLSHTNLSHTQSFTQQFFTQPLSHTQSLTHNFVTQQFFTHNFVTHTHSLWHLATSTCLLRGRHGAFGIGLDLRRGTLRGRRGTWRHPRCFCVAGMALMALGWVWWLVVRDAAALCVAGVALGDIDIPFAWQAWHLVTSTFHLRGRPLLPHVVQSPGRDMVPTSPRHVLSQVGGNQPPAGMERKMLHMA